MKVGSKVILALLVLAAVAWIIFAVVSDLFSGPQDCTPTTRPDAYDCEPLD